MLGKNLQKRILSFGLGFLLLAPFGTPFIQAHEVRTSQNEISNEKIKQTIHGFALNKTITHEKSNILQFRHDKTGAWLVVAKNNSLLSKSLAFSILPAPSC